jgi:dihydroorotate dehydrogenase (fumarate)
MSLATNIAGINLEHPVLNAAGTCKLLEGGDHDVYELARSATSAVMIGSITLDPREGNSGDVYSFDQALGISLNSLGLPCRGREYYAKHLPIMIKVAHDAGKALFVSVAGFSTTQFYKLADVAFTGGADLVEVNFGCPNVWQNGQQHRIFSFDEEAIGEALRLIQKDQGKDARVAVKLSPFSDPFKLAEVARVIAEFEAVKVVTSTNTFANGFLFAEGNRSRPRISVNYAGFAGPAMKPIGLGQVRQLRTLLPERIQIMGVGGVTSGDDVRDYLAVGASAVQTATAFLQSEPGLFSKILEDLTAE